MCAFQTGASYATRGNCLATANDAVRERTEKLLLSFVELAARWNAVIVFGSLQGRLKDEPDRVVGEARITRAMHTIGEQATARGVTITFEPVNHLEATNDFFSRGGAAIAKGDWAGAIDYYTQAIALDPKFAIAYLGRGIARERIRRCNETGSHCGSNQKILRTRTGYELMAELYP
ncbi:MAG: tetratricopeptide repeat protein [Verrucomicrobiota bacterium]